MKIEFWFEFASTYSYPAAMRIEALAAESRRAGRVAAVSVGADLSAAGLERFAVQYLPGEGPVHVARPGARVRWAQHSIAQTNCVPAQWFARRASGVRAFGGSVGAGVRSCCLQRELRGGRRDFQSGGRGAMFDVSRSGRCGRSWRRRRRRLPRTSSKLRPRKRWSAASSARRPSSSATNCSGATIGSKTPWRGPCADSDRRNVAFICQAWPGSSRPGSPRSLL